MQTQIRLILEEQSDQGLNSLLFHLHFVMKYPEVWAFYEFEVDYSKVSGVRKFRNFTGTSIQCSYV